jgi:hypothetical protein
MHISENGNSRAQPGGFDRTRGTRTWPARLVVLAALVWLAGLPAGEQALVAPAWAGDVLAGPVPAQVVRVVDGYIIEVRAHIWLGRDILTLVRLAGVDAPELCGDCALENTLAARATI